MTTAPDVAVVATQLARTDRRALSQAWYSALHLAHDDGAAARVPTRATGLPVPCALPARAHAPAASTTRGSATAGGAARKRDAAAVPPAVERRHVADAAAKRVERALARLASRAVRRPSHTVAIDGGRVTLLVRSDAQATRIVAVCAAPLRPAVERALAHARYALATVLR
jgi:hypothetical protein